MKLSIKVYYALQALLALASNQDAKPLAMRSIAKNNDIPLNFLEQILITLKKAGLVTSVRGNEGGYQLKKKPSLISCHDVVKVLVGKIQIIDKKGKRLSALDNFFGSLEQEINNKFLSVSLEKLLVEQKKLKKVVDFSI